MLDNIKVNHNFLTSLGNLKLTDFGMATMYCSKGIERLLDRRCGTPPYAAPEVGRVVVIDIHS
jgi:serine/threonine-protein kinase Chk1